MAIEPGRPALVAVVATLEEVNDPLLKSTSQVDYCELRLDLLSERFQNFDQALAAIVVPKIITVRDPLEGGASSLAETTRTQLFEQWLPSSTYVDLELRNLHRYSELLEEADRLQKGVILSFHDFKKTPDLTALEDKLAQVPPSGNIIFKIATRISEWKDIDRLVVFLQKHQDRPIAAMGMGELGKFSRVILARMGSCLTYCSLGHAVVPGQWPYARLKEILSELRD